MNSDKKQIHLRIAPELFKSIESFCKAHGMTINQFFTNSALNYFAQEERKIYPQKKA